MSPRGKWRSGRWLSGKPARDCADSLSFPAKTASIRTIRLVLIATCLLLVDCATVASAARITQALDARSRGDHQTAARLLAQEMETPLDPDDASYVIGIHTLYIDQVAEWAKQSGLEDWMDERVLAAHRKGLALPGTTEDDSGLNYTLAKYYSFTGRNGLALPFLYAELEQRRKLGQVYHEIKALDGIASAYSDMGQRSLSAQTSAELNALAARYFKEPGVDPADPYEWLQYSKMLKKQLDNIADRAAPGEMQTLWATLEPIVIKVVTPEFLSYTNYAVLLGISGQEAEARKALSRARELAEREGYADGIDVLCAEAQVEVSSEHWDAAEPLTAECLKRWNAEGLATDPVKLRIRAEVLEARGQLAEARDLFSQAAAPYERARASFSIADRAAFYSQRPVRAAIWGQVRTATRVAHASGEPADFLAALSAAERMRARQLGDYLGAEERALIAPARLAELRSSLPADTSVLSYVLMKDAFAVQGFDRQRFIARIVPYDRTTADRLRKLAGALSSPRASRALIDRELAALGKLFLEPVLPLLEGKGRSIVIADGALNLIPFDLLADPGTGRSLLYGRRVLQMSPSLRLLQPRSEPAGPRAEGLFAVADPVYGSSYQTVHADSDVVDSATRSLGIEQSVFFSPLPETRREVAQIARLFEGEPVEMLLGEEALESRVKSASLGTYRYIHLATHGILGNEVPGVPEPAIVLGREQGEDGLLLASEAMELDLRADIAVLSACKTGSGELVSGEGVLGMSRAFLVAGSQSVLVSLWSVDSLATEQLMVAFYEALRAGEPPATALRSAKLSIRGGSGTGSNQRGLSVVTSSDGDPGEGRHPYYWAAFVLLSSSAGEG